MDIKQYDIPAKLWNDFCDIDESTWWCPECKFNVCP